MGERNGTSRVRPSFEVLGAALDGRARRSGEHASDQDAREEYERLLRREFVREAERSLSVLSERFCRRMETAQLRFTPVAIVAQARIVEFEVSERTPEDLGILETLAHAETLAYGAPSSSPRGTVLEILSESCDPVPIAAIALELERRGFYLRRNSVQALMSRLKREGLVRRVGRGVYERPN